MCLDKKVESGKSYGAATHHLSLPLRLPVADLRRGRTECSSAAAQGNLPCFTYLLASFLLSLAKWPLGQLQTGSGLIYQRAVHVTAVGEQKMLAYFRALQLGR